MWDVVGFSSINSTDLAVPKRFARTTCARMGRWTLWCAEAPGEPRPDETRFPLRWTRFPPPKRWLSPNWRSWVLKRSALAAQCSWRRTCQRRTAIRLLGGGWGVGMEDGLGLVPFPPSEAGRIVSLVFWDH